MKHFYFLMAVSFSALSQVSGKIVASETGKPIPFVNIRISDSDVGTSADESGLFDLKLATTETALVFSAVGFKSRTIAIAQNATVELERDTYELPEISVRKKLGTEEFAIGDYKKSDSETWYATTTNPWKLARFYPISEQLKNTPFLDNIEILTKSEIKGATFIIHIYEIDDDGKPGKDLADTNIIGVAKKGKGYTRVDLKPYKLSCPDNGFFIGIEWLIIDANKKEEKYTDKEGNEKTITHYYPFVGSAVSTTYSSWFYMQQSEWRASKPNQTNAEYQKYYDEHYAERTTPMFKGFYERHEKMKGKTLEFAFNLTLTN